MALVIYTKPGCPYCAAARDHYRSEDIDFEEKVVTQDPEAMSEFRALSPAGLVPTIVDGDSVTLGWQGAG